MVLQLNEREIDAFVKKINFEKMKGLVPAIVQDSSNNKVLMLGFMNEEALRLTLAKCRMHFWSRSRGRIWLKGEESGHYSLLENAMLDCDNDTILFKAQQIGTVCHIGQETCFHNPAISEKKLEVDVRIIERIFEIIQDRIKNPSEKSYVSSLNSKGEDAVLRKIGEETVELILAGKGNQSKEIIHEATDIFFHILILLAHKDIKLQKIFEELEYRHQKRTQSS